MRSSPNNGLLVAFLGIVGMAYPVMLYAGRDTVPPLAFVILGLSLLLLRAGLSQQAFAIWRRPLLFALAPLVAVSLVDAALAARLYPVAMSLAAAAAFGTTLFAPPSLIERFARLRHKELPAEAVLYCRRVTWLWLVWLLLNAAVAALLALLGLDAAWTIWTGIVAYVVGAALLAGEWLFRRHFHPISG